MIAADISVEIPLANDAVLATFPMKLIHPHKNEESEVMDPDSSVDQWYIAPAWGYREHISAKHNPVIVDPMDTMTQHKTMVAGPPHVRP